MKTIDQIIAKIHDGGFNTDLFGFGTADLLQALPFESAKEFLKEEFVNSPTTIDEWKYLKTDDEVINEITNYVGFAQGKIDNERGLSSDRSCQHFIAWFWLIDEDFSKELEDIYNHNYAPYGQPVLDKVKEYLTNKEIKYQGE